MSESLPDGPPSRDTHAALRRFSRTFRLAILSDVDDDLFCETGSRLGVEFDRVITARQARSEEPSRRNFEVAMETVGIPGERWLHAAQSLFHDVAPAREIGTTTIRVDRRRGREGSAAAPVSSAVPHLEVGSLAELAERVAPGRE